MLPPALNCRGQSAAWLVRTVKIYYKRTIHTINRSVLLVSTMQTFLARFNNATNNVRSAKKIKKKGKHTTSISKSRGHCPTLISSTLPRKHIPRRNEEHLYHGKFPKEDRLFSLGCFSWNHRLLAIGHESEIISLASRSRWLAPPRPSPPRS